MIEKIKRLFTLIEAEFQALEGESFDLDVELDAHVIHCADFLRKFNQLSPEERFHFLTTTDNNGHKCWNQYVMSMTIYAISHAYWVKKPEPITDRTVDHMVIDDEPATIITTSNGERLSFDNFPEFGEAHFSNYFPLNDEAAIATKHIAMMCRGLGRIW